MTTGLKSTGNIIQETPQDFFDFLNGIFRFDLDVCALPENAKCERYYTPSDDGLKNPWGGGCMVQSALREGHHQLGQEGLGGVRQTVLPVHRHAASGEDGHEMVPGICVSLCPAVVRGRKAPFRRGADLGTVSQHGGGLHQEKSRWIQVALW